MKQSMLQKRRSMKFPFLLGAILLVCTLGTLSAQTATNTIKVYGLSETVVQPDEIYLSITLTEYLYNGMKVPLSELERKMLDGAKAMSITAIAVENLSGYGSYGYEGGGQDFLASKIYQVKVSTMKQAEELMNNLQSAGMSALATSYYANSKAKTYMRELKVKAIKNAQEEAEVLAKAAGKKIGNLISMEEVQDLNGYTTYPMDIYSNPPSAINTSATDARNITYKYSVVVVFELQ